MFRCEKRSKSVQNKSVWLERRILIGKIEQPLVLLQTMQISYFSAVYVFSLKKSRILRLLDPIRVLAKDPKISRG